MLPLLRHHVGLPGLLRRRRRTTQRGRGEDSTGGGGLRGSLRLGLALMRENLSAMLSLLSPQKVSPDF